MTSREDMLRLLAASTSTTAVDAARSILAKGVNPRSVDADSELTALHVACAWDNLAMCQLLLHFGADPMAKDKHGRTPISMAKGNTAKFMQRYLTRSVAERRGVLRRLFACHMGTGSPIIVRREPETRALEPTTFHRGNTLMRSMRAAKKKLRQSFNVLNIRRREEIENEFFDEVLTSEGVKTVKTPVRVPNESDEKQAGPRKSKSSSQIVSTFGIPDHRTVQNEDAAAKARKQAISGNVNMQNGENITPRRPNTTTTTARRARSKTPSGLSGRNPEPRPALEKQKRSRTPDFSIDPFCLPVLQQQQPKKKVDSTTNNDSKKSRAAGLKPRPTAPPLTPETEKKILAESEIPKLPRENPPKQVAKKRAQSKSREKIESDQNDVVALANGSDYLTADDTSFDLNDLKERFSQIAVTPHTKQKDVVTSPFVDDGEERKIRRMRDPELRVALKQAGIFAGPICVKTRRMYEKKLLDARRRGAGSGSNTTSISGCGQKYSPQLELAIRHGSMSCDSVARARLQDQSIRLEFARSGLTAFCYLIMDPRILGNDVAQLTFSRFVNSIFYVGKGTKNRPLAHFMDAKKLRIENSPKLQENSKFKTINEIWNDKGGIARHEIGHGISDEEAFVREAALLEALRIDNTTNLKKGEWHGSSKNWDSSSKAEFGVFLLQSALTTLKGEGIRLVYEDALPDTMNPFSNNRRAGGRTPK